MRHLILALAFAPLAQAATVCASPQDLKALQAAVLEQQLAAAAQSCHVTADYTRFVTAYRGAIVRQDQAVRRFFQHQKAGESYDAYKSRIAHEMSLKSLHDPRFCQTTKAVFDLALGRSGAAQPPALMGTGYEGCRAVPGKPIMAAAKPVPSVAPVRLAKAETVPVPKPAPLGPRALAAVNAVKPLPLVLPPRAKPPVKPVQLASIAPVQLPPAPKESEPLPPPDEAALPVHSDVGQSAKRTAAVDRPHWRQPLREFSDNNADDNVPYAYRQGSQWVGAESDDPPSLRRGSHLYRGPDGRWYVRIGHHSRWNDDE